MTTTRPVFHQGDVHKYVVTSNVGVLRNQDGEIQLLDPSGTLEQATQEGKPILF